MEGERQFKVKFQSRIDGQDPRGTIELAGPNFPNLVQEATERGYPRVISGEERIVTPWAPIEYDWDEATP